MRKTALGIVLALVLAAVPVALFSTTAVASGSAAVHVVNGFVAGPATAIDVYVDGIQVVNDLAIAQARDIALPDTSSLISVCQANSTDVNGSGVCRIATVVTPAIQIGAPNAGFSVVAGNAYTLVVTGTTAAPEQFANDQSPTGLGEFRYTLNVATGGGPTFDVCIGGVKVVSGIGNGNSAQVDVTAQQGAPYALFPSAGGCASPNANVNFVAGTNFVQTVAGTQNPTCAKDCVEVLLVGEGTVPNSPNTVAFCKAIIGLAGIQPALKTLIGNVDPSTKQRVIDTQPSVGDMKAFVTNTQAALDAGDSTVPAAIADSWATATDGLRKLLQTFKLSGYDLSNLPLSAVEALVEGANGFKLPGVPPDEDVVAATAALTAFYTGTCSAAPTPGPAPAPPAPTPLVAGPRFTG